jgi:hypothetical protein
LLLLIVDYSNLVVWWTLHKIRLSIGALVVFGVIVLAFIGSVGKALMALSQPRVYRCGSLERTGIGVLFWRANARSAKDHEWMPR